MQGVQRKCNKGVLYSNIMSPDAWQISQMEVAAILRGLRFQVLEEVPISSGRIDVLAHKRQGKNGKGHVLILCEVKDYKKFGKSQELKATEQMLKYVKHLAETGTGYRPTRDTRIYSFIVTASESTIWQKELTNLIDREKLLEVNKQVQEFRAFIVTTKRFKHLLTELGLLTRVQRLDHWVRKETED